MPQTRYNTIVPLGSLAVAAEGTTVLLSANCGPLAGQAGPITDYNNPPLPGQPLRQLILTNTSTTATAYLLPRGQTFTGNPGTVIAAILPGKTLVLPYGQPFENGVLPENFCLDGSAAVTVIGCGILS